MDILIKNSKWYEIYAYARESFGLSLYKQKLKFQKLQQVETNSNMKDTLM